MKSAIQNIFIDKNNNLTKIITRAWICMHLHVFLTVLKVASYKFKL